MCIALPWTQPSDTSPRSKVLAPPKKPVREIAYQVRSHQKSTHGHLVLPDAGNTLTPPDMHRHSRLNKSSKQRSATLLVLSVIAVCSLLALHPVLKGRTNSLLGPAKQKAKLQAIPDDSQTARERAQQLGLVPTGKFPISKYDLVSAMPSDQTHLPVVKGSRSWRKVCSQGSSQSTKTRLTKCLLWMCCHCSHTSACCQCRASVQ